ncbi:hypothetical protein D3C87_1608820 [compost metagenome]
MDFDISLIYLRKVVLFRLRFFIDTTEFFSGFPEAIEFILKFRSDFSFLIKEQDVFIVVAVRRQRPVRAARDHAIRSKARINHRKLVMDFHGLAKIAHIKAQIL